MKRLSSKSSTTKKSLLGLAIGSLFAAIVAHMGALLSTIDFSAALVAYVRQGLLSCRIETRHKKVT